MLTQEKKKELTNSFLQKHLPLLDKLNVKNPYFKCKIPYVSSIDQQKVIGIFKSEFTFGTDIYLQLVYTDYNPYEKKEVLYVIKKNPHFEQEYKAVGTGENIRYEVPVIELIEAEELIEQAIEFEIEDVIDEDIPLTQATLRDFAAIMLKKPVSNKKWLNQIITK